MTAFFHEVLKSERHYVSQTLRLLAHIETDRLYADMGCSSLYAYCTQELGLSEQRPICGSTWRAPLGDTRRSSTRSNGVS